MKEFTYLFLALAVIAEVIATSSLKATEEFTKIVPTIVMIVAYLVSFYFMTLVLKFIPLGITYAIWSGVGIVLVTIVGAWKYKEIPDLPSILGMGLIISGVVVIHVFSKNINH
ncbi:SMR family transporter [Cocleimonas flava]|jgi:small multidrug resistance pump|uniref:Small multidrug resistance pump n=1 Tax=Cocleimonas flava TaxID=634765 RepID=A0A4R1F3P5_9GAMM|nr:SMR family transporter [Cocleimonas flava]TCJ87202.1 small multidrug resistance pump [Cocleimonas flava]